MAINYLSNFVTTIPFTDLRAMQMWRANFWRAGAAEAKQERARAQKRRRNEKRLARGWRPRHVRASV